MRWSSSVCWQDALPSILIAYAEWQAPRIPKRLHMYESAGVERATAPLAFSSAWVASLATSLPDLVLKQNQKAFKQEQLTRQKDRDTAMAFSSRVVFRPGR